MRPATLQKVEMDKSMNAAIADGRCEVCPLTRVKAGAEVRVRELCASPEVKRRLREIGVREDQIIQLLFSQTGYICRVCNARLAISEQLAQLIMVEPVLTPVRVAAEPRR